MQKLQLLPAVDVRAGKAVRLVQGASSSASDYCDPVDAALDWIAQGAEWIHLVDLDLAFGTGENTKVLQRVINAVPGVKIQISGGISDTESLQRALSLQPCRINLSTAALADIGWVQHVIAEHGDLIAVGLDVRGETLSARGQQSDIGNLWQILEQLDAVGCARYVVTDVLRDGALSGPNIELLLQVTRHTKQPIVASGGVSQLADISALKQLVSQGLEAVIVGKALYAGNFTLAQVLKAAG